MKRIDTKDGLFDDGNHVFGIHGTRVSAEFLNDIQEEIVNVIGAKNLDGSKRDQLITAIRNIVKSGGGSSSGSAITQADQDKIDSSYHKLKHFVENELGIALDAKNDAQLKTAIDSAIAKLQAQLDAIKTEQLSQNNKINTIAQIDIRVGDNSTSIADIRKKMTNGSTETTAGVAEIATQQEANNGTDDSKIVTPKKLKTITRDLDSRATRIRNDVDVNTAAIVKLKQGGGTTTTTNVPLATETTKGVAEIATQDEANDGNDDSKIVTPKKLKTITRDLDSRATRIRNDVDRNTADLVTHRTDIQQNTTDINATKSNTATNTANITKILGNLANITPTTTAGRLVNSFTVPNTLHDKISLKGEAVTGTYGYDVKVRGDILTVSDPTLQEVVVYRRDKNNKKLFSLEDVHRAKSRGSIYIENSQVHIANKDGKHIDVFEYDATKPQLTFNKTHSLTLTNSYGKSIAINKDFLIVGDPETKTVLVYSHVGQLWLLVKQLKGAVGFGSRVSMSSEFIYVTQDKQVKVFNLNFTNVKTFTGTAAYKISAEEHLVALLDTGNNLIEVDRDNVPFTQLTIKSNCLDVHGLYLLLVDKTIPKAYVFGIYNKTGWFKTTQTKWTGIPDNNDGYVAYVVKGGDYQLVKPINTTDYYTKFANGGWVKNGTWGGKLYYTTSEIGISKTDAGKITITDGTSGKGGFGFSDAHGVVWVGAGHNGLGRLDTSTGKITITDRTSVYGGFGFSDAQGVVWVGAGHNGLGRLDTSTGKITITDSTSVGSGFGFVDGNGVVWIGTASNGVGRLDTSTGKITITDSISVIYGFGFADGNGVVWIGTNSKGLGRLDTSTGKITITDSVAVIYGFGFVDAQGVVWIGTRNSGLGRLDTSTGKITITGSVAVMEGFGFSDGNGVTWVGTQNSGLGRLDTSTGKITSTDRTNVRAGFGFVDGNGVGWIGTRYRGFGFVTSGKDKLYLNTTSGKTYYGSKEVKDSLAFDEIIEHSQPYKDIKPVIELPTKNIKMSETDIQEQPNKTGKYVSLLGTSTPRTPQAFDDAIFNIDAGFGDACALTANNVLVTNKTDSKLAVYDFKGKKLKEIQLTAGLGSTIDATEDEAIVGSETANTVDVINLKI